MKNITNATRRTIERLKREEAALGASIENFRANDLLPRDALHLRDGFTDWSHPEAERAFRVF